MPWYDPWDLYTLPWDDEPMKKSTAMERAREKLRSRPLSKRTSTYTSGSTNANVGAAAEVTAQNWLQEELTWSGAKWTVLLWNESRRVPLGFGPFDDDMSWVAIDNSKNGDLYVYRDRQTYFGEPKLLFSVEVKSSEQYPSIAISYSELFDGGADYLLGVTTYGTWICRMDEARRAAKMRESYRSTFYTVDPMQVSLLTIKEIIDAEERPKPQPILDPDDRDDIPF